MARKRVQVADLDTSVSAVKPVASVVETYVRPPSELNTPSPLESFVDAISPYVESKVRQEQAQNLIEVAKEVCDESEELKEQLPELVDMVERRVASPEESPKAGGGILARLKLSDEAGIHLTIDKDEEAILRSIPFIDD